MQTPGSTPTTPENYELLDFGIDRLLEQLDP
jgi:hypothetical protein